MVDLVLAGDEDARVSDDGYDRGEDDEVGVHDRTASLKEVSNNLHSLLPQASGGPRVARPLTDSADVHVSGLKCCVSSPGGLLE